MSSGVPALYKTIVKHKDEGSLNKPSIQAFTLTWSEKSDLINAVSGIIPVHKEE
jgi:hypothetical protein